MPDNNQIIGATLKVDTGTSSQNIAEVNKGLKETKVSLKDAGAEVKTTGKAFEESAGPFGKIKEHMEKLPGPLKEGAEGVGKLSTAFKALLANPVVLVLTAIVAALALIYKAFTNTFEGGEKMEQIFAAIKAAGQALIDNLDKIGSAIVKVFKFDFSGAINDIKGVANAAIEAAGKMAELTKQSQEIHREELKNDLEQAERAKRLAILREQASDENVKPAERKKALQELKADAEQNYKDDVELAKKATENKIAQLTIQRDGAKKNQDEINKLKIDQINVETTAANELRRIGRQITQADRQEKAEQKAAAAEAAAARKAARAELIAYEDKLIKLQQDTNLLTIKDAYKKEQQALENKIEDEKRVIALSFQDGKIKREQYNELIAAVNLKAGLEQAALTDKHNKEVEKKEAEFQKELATIRGKTMVDGITDVRKAELVQLEIGYQEKLQQAIEHYKDDQAKFLQVKQALDEQLRAAQNKAQEKFKKEDAKKAFEAEEERQKVIVQAHNFDFEAKYAAIIAEQKLVEQAFKDKLITEKDYNEKVFALTEARRQIRDAEAQHQQEVLNVVAGAFDGLATIAGKQTALGKALSIASTTINTFESAIAAFRNVVKVVPGPVGVALGTAAAAAAVANGIAAVKKIVAVQIPGQGGGGAVPTAGGIGNPAPIAPTVAGTQLNAASLNSINNPAAAKAFVLDSDVKNNRDRDERLNRAARLGGG